MRLQCDWRLGSQQLPEGGRKTAQCGGWFPGERATHQRSLKGMNRVSLPKPRISD